MELTAFAIVFLLSVLFCLALLGKLLRIGRPGTSGSFGESMSSEASNWFGGGSDSIHSHSSDHSHSFIGSSDCGSPGGECHGGHD